jgi:hypothetical protein
MNEHKELLFITTQKVGDLMRTLSEVQVWLRSMNLGESDQYPFPEESVASFRIGSSRLIELLQSLANAEGINASLPLAASSERARLINADFSTNKLDQPDQIADALQGNGNDGIPPEGQVN